MGKVITRILNIIVKKMHLVCVPGVMAAVLNGVDPLFGGSYIQDCPTPKSVGIRHKHRASNVRLSQDNSDT